MADRPWSLIVGFTLSAIAQALVKKATVSRLLGERRPRTLAVASGFAIASSLCSYTAVALARSLFRKGADSVAATAFEIASTNVVMIVAIMALFLGCVSGVTA